MMHELYKKKGKSGLNEFERLAKRSNWYSNKYAIKARRLMRINTVFDVISIFLTIIIITTLKFALNGEYNKSYVQPILICSSSLIALINAFKDIFIKPSKIAKLFYASNQFYDIKEKADRYNKNRNFHSTDIEKIFKELNNEYAYLKKLYIEFYEKTEGYYFIERIRNLKKPDINFYNLPSVKNIGKSSDIDKKLAEENRKIIINNWNWHLIKFGRKKGQVKGEIDISNVSNYPINEIKMRITYKAVSGEKIKTDEIKLNTTILNPGQRIKLQWKSYDCERAKRALIKLTVN